MMERVVDKLTDTDVCIWGYGWVGQAMHTLFPHAKLFDPPLGLLDDKNTKIAFICVPTPLKEDGSLDCSIVEASILDCPSNLIIIRSTVMPGFTDRMVLTTGKQIVFQPEYLGETVAHPLADQLSRPFLILGGMPIDRRNAIELYHLCYNASVTIRQTSAYEAEVIKLSENRAIAFKVAQCQELYDVCELAGIDYYTVREAVYRDDPRFNTLWTFIYPNSRGFKSKCIPKDVYGWSAWAESLGYKPELTKRMLELNEEYINKEG